MADTGKQAEQKRSKEITGKTAVSSSQQYYPTVR